MPAIALTPEQTQLRDRLIELLNQLMNWADAPKDQVNAWLDELSEKAFLLHQQLKAEGQEPQYSPSAMAKRGMSPKTPEFYRHMYGVECLLQFLEKGI